MTEQPTDPQHHHALDPKRELSALQVFVQIFGGLIGVGLLIWALSVVFSDENREQLDRALNSPLHLTLSLVGLSALSIVLNGLMFWVVARPIRRLDPLSVIGVNAIATFLSVLPAKLGLAIRGLVHNRRDGMTLRDVIAWLAAMSALGIAALLPIGVVSKWRLEVDLVWFVLALGGVALTHTIGVGLGKLAARGVLRGALAVMSLGSYRIVQHPGPVASHAVLRVADLGVLAVRFLIAASVLQMVLPFEQAVLLGAMYFFFGVLAPAGTLGAREAAVAEIGVALGLDRAPVYTAVLFVAAIELATSFVLALVASIWIRPDRLLRAQRNAATEGAAASPV